ncbi:MAG: DUF262 domain-containing protein, partial [Cyclobacteriaceae bacterium]
AICIPHYQRPYKWTVHHVTQLIDDILHHSNKKVSAYRIGTLVIHKEGEGKKTKLNVVDGQQRTVTLALIALALQEQFDDNDYVKEEPAFTDHLHFTSDISKKNIRQNYDEIKRRVN